ncbi:hypothetical protein Tco_1039075 [Tanacetum coccineum]
MVQHVRALLLPRRRETPHWWQGTFDKPVYGNMGSVRYLVGLRKPTALPIMIDSYTSSMCKDSWGRSSIVRTLIDLRADVDLKENMVVVVPRLDGRGTTLSTICIEYERKPSLVFRIWKTFGRITRDLGSFGEETDKTTDLHQHLSRMSLQWLETASQIQRDAVTTKIKTASPYLTTASQYTTQPNI